MTQPSAVEKLDQWRRRLNTWTFVVPYAALAGSLILVFVADAAHLIPQRPLPYAVLLALLAAGWLAWWVTLHPQWERRRALMAVFFLGLLVLIGMLIWVSPLFGFFAWTGYLFTVYALTGWWRLAGAGAVAWGSAISQMGGFAVFRDADAMIAFAVVLIINTIIAVGMTYLTMVTHELSAKRAQTIDELAEANAKLATALRENAGLHAQLLNQAREAGVLDERQRMAGEIHDVLAQGLTGIVTQLEAAGAAADRPADWRRHLDAAKRLARDSLAEARRSVQALRPQISTPPA